MFNDILGNKKNKPEGPTTEELIKAMEYNIKTKEKLIKDLVKKVTDLERQLEAKNQETHAGI